MIPSQPIRILLVEDEFITRDNLRDTLEDIGYQISGEAMRADEALEILDEGETDLVILDIQLRGKENGIWLGEQIKQLYGIPFLYLTAFGDARTVTAAAATEPVSYLVKPFTAPGVFAAIELALHLQAGVEPPVTAGGGITGTGLLINESIFVKNQLVYQRVSVSDIAYVQSFRNYLDLQVGGGRFVVRSSLREFCSQLPADVFMQTHRSYVVNLKKVDLIGQNFLRIGDTEIPLSRALRPAVLERLILFS